MARLIEYAVQIENTGLRKHKSGSILLLHRKSITCVIALTFGCVGSIISLRYFNLPYFWIGMLWAFASGFVAVVVSHSTSRVVLANVAGVAAALSLSELYLWARVDLESRYEGVYEDGRYMARDEILGYAPVKNIRRPSARHYVGDDLIYDVRYSIDANGLRRTTPNGSVRSPARCILFFGGSFTFGEGVNDDETMPQQVAIRAPEPVRVYNFGFHGYGPHQMLSALEHGVVDRVVDRCSGGLVVIYQAIPDHVKRVAGLYRWDRHGPRYRLASDGHVEFTGHFDDQHINDGLADIIVRSFKKRFKKSLLWQHIFGYEGRYWSSDVDLFIGVVKRAREIVEGSGGEFDMILWDTGSSGSKVVEALQRSGVAFHPISKILPDYASNPEKYSLHRYDRHPNPVAHAIIAAYIADHILWRDRTNTTRVRSGLLLPALRQPSARAQTLESHFALTGLIQWPGEAGFPDHVRA